MNAERAQVRESFQSAGGPRLGLCCQFIEEPIKFRTTTATAMLRLPMKDWFTKLSVLCRDNASALHAALRFCATNGIGAFRVNSQILPLKTHPEIGYTMDQLQGGEAIIGLFRKCGEYAQQNGVRLSFHPDQFVVLNTPNPKTLAHSLAELEYQTEVAEWIGADTINLHGGGAYGNKTTALDALMKSIRALPERVRERLTLENDDKVYTPAELLPVCEATGVPFVYDVHHHRCLPDGMSIEAATMRAVATWNREPLFHLSSPIEGWDGPKPERHHDYIALEDFPAAWRNLAITIEVEAKAKELAVLRLLRGLKNAA